MDVIVRGKNVEVTAALKDHVTRKLSKLSKYFDHRAVTAHARLVVEGDDHVIEVTMPLDGLLLRAEETSPDMYASIDRVVDKLERQLLKYKARVKPRHGHEVKNDNPHHPEELVRRKTFPRKPMTVDEALMQMDLLGHDFFAFTNAETEMINVVYRRQDGGYGLLEPS
ncbi:MAG: ribosome-associated translation inhibitor RaiA [Firmicutes bacterium]|nr:ribosome-associated translation inhibitor RaiA [Bacillota bacterium]